MTGTSFWICNEKSWPWEVIVCHCHRWLLLSPLLLVDQASCNLDPLSYNCNFKSMEICVPLSLSKP
ncbi:hypothetical protein ACJW31_08G086300 [Castanea mollissima]